MSRVLPRRPANAPPFSEDRLADVLDPADLTIRANDAELKLLGLVLVEARVEVLAQRGPVLRMGDPLQQLRLGKEGIRRIAGDAMAGGGHPAQLAIRAEPLLPIIGVVGYQAVVLLALRERFQTPALLGCLPGHDAGAHDLAAVASQG